MINALLTTAVEASAIFPVIPVVKIPVGIIVIAPPLVEMGAGVLMVLIVPTPESKNYWGIR